MKNSEWQETIDNLQDEIGHKIELENLTLDRKIQLLQLKLLNEMRMELESINMSLNSDN